MPIPGVGVGRESSTPSTITECSTWVVGGFAVELWDVAVLPNRRRRHRARAAVQRETLTQSGAALNELEAVLRYGDEGVAIPAGFTAENIVDMNVLNLNTVAGPLDLTIMPAGTEGYPDLIRSATEIEYEGIAVSTACLEDVARTKEAAGRPKDLRTLPAIRAHIRRRSAR